MANDLSIPEEYKNRKIWSYSRLSSYLGCPHSYYLGYVQKIKGKDNIYSSIGGLVHEVMEDLQDNKLSKEEAKVKFLNGVKDINFNGLDFNTETEKDGYVKSIIDFINKYERIECKSYQIEKKEFLEIDSNNILIMFIDLIFNVSEDSIEIHDYKTSSKFKKEDLAKYGRQLVLYAYTILNNNKNIKDVKIAWQMLKYYFVDYNGKQYQVKRNNLIGELKAKITKELKKLGFDELTIESKLSSSVISNSIPEEVKDKFVLTPCVLYYEYNKETISDMIDFVITTIHTIENDKEFISKDLSQGTYFCDVLCSYSGECKYLKEHKMEDGCRFITDEEDLF